MKKLVLMILCFCCIPQTCFGLRIIGQKMVDVFVRPGDEEVCLNFALRTEGGGERKVSIEENIFSMDRGIISCDRHDPLMDHFLDPNLVKESIDLDGLEEKVLDAKIKAGIDVKSGSYPRVLVFSPENNGNSPLGHMGAKTQAQTLPKRVEYLVVYVNVIGTPVRNLDVKISFLPSPSNKKILISGMIANKGNFYSILQGANFSILTDNERLVAKSFLRIDGSSKQGEMFIFPGERQIFRGEINDGLLEGKYKVRVNFISKDLQGHLGEVAFELNNITKEFPLEISKKMSVEIWGPLPHFELDPSEEEKDVYVLKEGNGMYQTWEVKNRTSEPLIIQVSALPKEWDVIFPAKFVIAPDGSYEFDAKLLNPKGIQELRCELIFQAMDLKGGMVGRIAKKIIQRGDGE